MPPLPARFTQVDIRRAAKAAWSVDPDARVQVVLPDGTRIIIDKGSDATPDKSLEARREIRL